MRVCSLCWHSLELLSDGPLDAESPLAVATSNDEATQPEGAILTLTAVAKHGNDDAMSALSRKLTERLQEPEIPVKLKALRLCALLAHDGSPSFQVRSLFFCLARFAISHPALPAMGLLFSLIHLNCTMPCNTEFP